MRRPLLRILFLLLLIGPLWPDAALACESCFGAAGNSMTVKAISLSMLTLLFTIGGVFFGVMAFFGNIEKRSQMLASGALVVDATGATVPPTEADAVTQRLALDRLLDKINRQGYDQLTPYEQDLLRALSADPPPEA